MTRADIFINILAEATGKAANEVAAILDRYRLIDPTGRWDDTVPPGQAKAIIADLRTSADEVLVWLSNGGAMPSPSHGKTG